MKNSGDCTYEVFHRGLRGAVVLRAPENHEDLEGSLHLQNAYVVKYQSLNPRPKKP